jgi:hypothetical protein
MARCWFIHPLAYNITSVIEDAAGAVLQITTANIQHGFTPSTMLQGISDVKP